MTPWLLHKISSQKLIENEIKAWTKQHLSRQHSTGIFIYVYSYPTKMCVFLYFYNSIQFPLLSKRNNFSYSSPIRIHGLLDIAVNGWHIDKDDLEWVGPACICSLYCPRRTRRRGLPSCTLPLNSVGTLCLSLTSAVSASNVTIRHFALDLTLRLTPGVPIWTHERNPRMRYNETIKKLEPKCKKLRHFYSAFSWLLGKMPCQKCQFFPDFLKGKWVSSKLGGGLPSLHPCPGMPLSLIFLMRNSCILCRVSYTVFIAFQQKLHFTFSTGRKNQSTR